jgi:hypothetical protein
MAATSAGGAQFPVARCGDGQALMGANLFLNGNSRLSGVRGVCANVEQWTNVALPAPPTTLIQTQGSGGWSTQQVRCFRGELLTGFEVSTGTLNGVNVVTAVRPICRDFRAF